MAFSDKDFTNRRSVGHWSTIFAENSLYVTIGKITKEQAELHAHLKIAGLVGSIDNDMSMTDLTIGAPTALHRICEALDNIDSTASSHSRAFVIEVMGRHCGWLALLAGVRQGDCLYKISYLTPCTAVVPISFSFLNVHQLIRGKILCARQSRGLVFSIASITLFDIEALSASSNWKAENYCHCCRRSSRYFSQSNQSGLCERDPH
jgi:hypothetical protein